MATHQVDFSNKIVEFLLHFLESNESLSDSVALKISLAIIKIQMNKNLCENEKMTHLLQSCSGGVLQKLLCSVFEKSQAGFYNETVAVLVELLEGNEKFLAETPIIFSSIIRRLLKANSNENEKMTELMQICPENVLQELLLYVSKKYKNAESPDTGECFSNFKGI